ncbi:sperm-associated antigen 7 [Contarinia nasturtii]|uniref:sperm-associated antigen 7 n=1 Tax=Contarinia nasturtii TaxID=265458 RepID=UPI0012D3ED0D|nr:sperm-associated antigen 7 [Contarinia nasturtii]
MDLLGSILNSMDKPPEIDEKRKEQMKKQKEQVEKQQEYEKREMAKFRAYCEERVNRFIKDENRKFLQFQPLNRFYRSIVHDVSQIAGLTAMSFGIEDVDRYIVVYKKDLPPSEDEISARRNGEEWNKDTAQKYAQKRLEEKEMEQFRETKSTEVKPNSNYKDKYAHLIGQEAAVKAAKKTETNKSYGFVPSENKRDMRTIEDVQADLQAKKKMRLSQATTSINDNSTAE